MRKPWSVPDYANLTVEHARLKRLYGVAVDHLFAMGYQVTDAEYQRLKNSVEEARVQAQIAGTALAEHRAARVHAKVHSKAG